MKIRMFFAVVGLLGIIAILLQGCDETETQYDVIVVGAGIAGLTTGYYLDDYDLDVLVLEKESRPGGRTVSGSHKGLVYAKGTEYLGKPSGSLAEILNDLEITPKEIPLPVDATYRNGLFYWSDEGLALMYISESSVAEYNAFVSAMLQYAVGYEDVPFFDLTSDLAVLDSMTADEWFDEQGFADIYRETFNVASRGLFGAGLDEISALSMIPESAFQYIGSTPITDTGDLENAPEQAAGERSFTYSFVTGITEVTDALAEHLGARVKTDAGVVRVEQEDENYTVTYAGDNATELTVTARSVVLAVPSPVVLDVADGVLGEEQKSLLKQISYAPYITVALFSLDPIFNQAFDLAVPDGLFFTDLYDSTWVQREYDPSAAQIDAHIVSAYVAPDSYTDMSLLQLTDEQVLENVYQDLEILFPGAQEKVAGYDIQRFLYAYPVMTPGAYSRLTRLHASTTGTLVLAGDYMVYPTFEAAVEAGRLAAEQIIEALR